MIVRAAAPADHARIVGVLDDWWGGRPMTDMLPRLFLDHFASTSLVADADDGSLAAFLVGFVSPDQAGTAYVHFVGVAPDQRRSGLAADLYGRFFAIARAAGAVRVKAVTSPLNDGSQQFHRSLGFTVSAPVVDYDGRGGDRVVMSYRPDGRGHRLWSCRRRRRQGRASALRRPHRPEAWRPRLAGGHVATARRHGADRGHRRAAPHHPRRCRGPLHGA